jgi:2-amino-4-hydroxy-6-hydroxymethyldihydropteridine diphosphokinase
MARCLIGCGSNLGKRRDQLDRAIELLRFMPGITLDAVSRYRQTRPVGGPPRQRGYLNGACTIETELSPHDVLGMLAAVENTLHRERAVRWGPRSIDLDLLLYEDLVVDSDALTLPHPRMTTRRFVLEPCVEIAPEWWHPPASCTLRDLLENISVPNPLVTVIGVPGSGAPEVAAAVADATMARLLRAPSPLPAPPDRSHDAAGREATSRKPSGFSGTPSGFSGTPSGFSGTPSGAGASRELSWRATLATWSRPLAADAWPTSPQATVADYWLDGALAAMAAELPPESLDHVHADLDRLAAECVTPHVAILLVADAATIEERIAFRCRGAGPATDVFADIALAGSAVCDAPRQAVADLLSLQERLIGLLRCPESCHATGHVHRRPKAVIVIDAGDLAQATAEATAAVEAML